MRDIDKDDIGKRLLLTDRHTGIPRTEVTVLELSPSGANVKIKNNSTGMVYWSEVYDYRVVEVLETKIESRLNSIRPTF